MRSELIDLKPEYERQFYIAARSIDLTAVYNVHADAGDADESTGYVQPNSVVFIEGFGLNGGNGLYENALIDLSLIRYTEGRSSDLYIDKKAIILDNIAKVQTAYVSQGPNDFTHHSLASIKALVQKDCLVFYADRRDFTNYVGTIGQTLNNYFREDAQTLHEEQVLKIGLGYGLGRVIKDLGRNVHRYASLHATRELHATQGILNWTAALIELGPGSDIPKDSRGRFSAYLLYGTAHARSLTSHLESVGIRPRVLELKSLPEGDYLDQYYQVQGNLNRRMGYAALKLMTHYFNDPKSAQTIGDQVYEHLEFLNQATDEEVLKFLIICISASQDLGKDNSKAIKEYYAILRSFMPNPLDFLLA